MAGETLSFGPFSLIASQRLLMRGGAPVELGARALDILIALASRPNEVIGKKELIAQVWPDVIVEEGNLRFHVAALRKALGDGRDGARYIATLAGRGYCFVAPVSVLSSRPDTNGTAAAALPALNVPPRLLRMVGRADDVQAISTELIASRFVSVVGPGGVGKTTVAVAVAHHMLQAFAGAALFLDLTAMGNPDVTAASLASLLGISVQSKDPTASLIAYLRDKRLLLVFDNCEHIIDAAAALTEGIFREAPDVNILITSREALRVEGEKVYRLPPLLVPPENPGLTAAAALTYPAVQLFVERAAASGARIVLQDADVATVASICRRLDGMALAIELAAGRVAGYGLQQTAALLDERLSLMWLGQRTAPPRQKTLQATLDWSHGLLSAEERIVLRRLAAFVGYFTLEATRAVATSATVDEALVLNAIDSLIAKSMVVVVPGTGSTMRYRLLDASRAYARVKLVESGEAEAVARRHVVYYRDLLQRTDTRSSPGDRSERRAALAEHLGNVRAALEWSLADRGDVELGIQLAAVSAALFIELSLLSEYCRWAGRALSALDAGTRGSRWEMELQAGLAHCIMYTKGNGEEAQSALERASVIAAALGDGPGQLRVLTRLHMHLRRAGYFGRLLPVAQQIEAIASSLGDPIGVAAAHSILGASHHLVGNQARASHNLDASLRGSEFRRIDASHFGFHFDPHIPLARVLWLQGYPDKAVQAAIEVTREGAPYQDPVTLCVALIWGMAVYQWRKAEAKLNAVAQFVTEIDGLDIHFVHFRSPHLNALPLIMTHGWPGSVFELLKTVGPLTDPTSHGGSAEDAFHLVLPSLPGFGFSGKPKGTGWNPERIARAWAELMKRLGYTRYVAQGGDWGSPVSSAMARQATGGLLGIHINLPATIPPEIAAVLASGGPPPAGLPEKERAAFASLDTFYKKYRAYGTMMGTRPQVIGQALTDSPAGLAAWMYDYNNGEPERLLNKDEFLDNVTLYWLTNSATSSARLYWETSGQSVLLAAAQKTSEIALPVAITVFPDEVYRAPETWARRAYRNLIYFNEADKGGHFAAWEQPELFAAELRAAFRSLRSVH